jgi:hypothetical protein
MEPQDLLPVHKSRPLYHILGQLVSVQTLIPHFFDILEKLSSAEIKKRRHIKISDRLAETWMVLQTLTGFRKNVRKNIQVSAEEILRHYELMQHKLQSDEECYEG